MAIEREAIDAVLQAFSRAGGHSALGSGAAGGLGPSAEQLRALLSHPGDGPVQMINLLKFRAQAAYPSEHELAGAPGGTGSEAYARYGQVALGKVAERGGRLVWMGVADQVLIGDLPDWDQVAIIEYPNRAAFLAMIQDPEYIAAHVHREAGLERTAILATTAVVDSSKR